MKLLLGIVIVAGFFIGINAHAWGEYDIVLVDQSESGAVRKYYDNATGIVCYTVASGYTNGGISCLKN